MAWKGASANRANRFMAFRSKKQQDYVKPRHWGMALKSFVMSTKVWRLTTLKWRGEENEMRGGPGEGASRCAAQPQRHELRS